MPRILAAMIGMAVAVAIGVLFVVMTRDAHSGDRPEVGANDIVLQRLRKSNPMLRIEKRLNDDFNRVPVYWINEPNSSRSIPFPRSVAEEDSVVIEFMPCDDAAIPARLILKGATTTACVRVTSVDHVMNAFCFLATARLNDVVTHFDGPSTGRRLDHRYAEETGHDGDMPDGARGFQYSYFLHESGEGTTFYINAFVGYTRVRQPSR